MGRGLPTITVAGTSPFTVATVSGSLVVRCGTWVGSAVVVEHRSRSVVTSLYFRHLISSAKNSPEGDDQPVKAAHFSANLYRGAIVKQDP